ncbi:ATP-dependent helicase HrpB [Natronospira proteinivora]|uniref:ATP-dependent helicase HrpB n=1 Tax=Natronospira proteinivora TaxID=1807133 RepID=A0ABT1G7M3_9GAMM|nr:ATP-dependent helicase HrpB [Natronospira proteinivora]MCP1727296.1 ATP-dependent helicase HrpB [Natronospira proteinivora]
MSATNKPQPSLPIDHCLPRLQTLLAEGTAAVLQAAPGAGKTTRVPPALLAADWLGGRRILMLEPRRLAARAAARFMAREMGEAVGETVGYRTRLDTQVSARTRIEVVTEGILTRMIQADPELADYGLVIFDEFHERSLQADLGLALVRESQQALREDLRVLVMSATLDCGPVAELLNQAPVIDSPGRSFPVSSHYLGSDRQTPLPVQTARAVQRALSEESGSILVFLPGTGEIRRTASQLKDSLPADVELAPLYGNLPPAEQDRAIEAPPPGRRKVVLATNIAQTSLTIEGIRVVIDSGLERRSAFDPNSGMSRLITTRVSQAAAEQRQGRAGRLEPGVCFRLWSESEQSTLAAHSPPEILSADLAPVVLELAQWGCRDPKELEWLTPPPLAHWRQAVSLLQWLDALDETGQITAHGRSMLKLGLSPRLAHLVVRGRELGLGNMAAELAALLSERDPLGREQGADLEHRLRALREGQLPKARLKPLQQTIRKLGHKADSAEPGLEAIGRLLALAFPDRIARRRPGRLPRYQLSNGRGAFLAENDPLGQAEWLVAAELDGQAREARIHLAAQLDPAVIEGDLAAHIQEGDTADWDEQRGQLIAQRERRLGQLVLAQERLPDPDPEIIQAGLLSAVRRKGLDALPWTDAARQYRARLAWMHYLEPEHWPKMDEPSLLDSLEEWLAPFLAGYRRWSELKTVPLLEALKQQLSYPRQQALEKALPGRLTIPTGESVRLGYERDPAQDQGPVLAVKLQAAFGLAETPRLADGRLPVVFHLLSPAGRPLAVTADLASFWRQAYPEVRKDMRGRYPKHPWPEDPLSATPTRRTKGRPR